jgi:hypothetical protein
MNTSLLEKFRDLVAFPVEHGGVDHSQPPYERFAIPYSFKPQLSLAQAVIAAGGAVLRIFFGSLFFAIWGTYSFLAWSTIRNLFGRVAVLVFLALAFAISMALLMVAVSASVKMVWPRVQNQPAKIAPPNLM